MESDSLHEQAFEVFAERAMKEFGERIERIILYGSTARGEAQGIKSDVDILGIVVTRDLKSDRYAIANDVMLTYEVTPSLYVRTVEDYEREKERPFVQGILREGRAYA